MPPPDSGRLVANWESPMTTRRVGLTDTVRPAAPFSTAPTMLTGPRMSVAGSNLIG